MSDATLRLHTALDEWCLGYEKDDAWLAECESRDTERTIIDLARSVPSAVELPPGAKHLYRGQGIPDGDMAKLLAGEEVVIESTCRLFTSWSTEEAIAERFAYDAADACMMSAVVIKMPIGHLDVICAVPDHLRHGEKEVLVHSSPLTVSPSDLIQAWLYDDDIGRSAEVESIWQIAVLAPIICQPAP